MTLLGKIKSSFEVAESTLVNVSVPVEQVVVDETVCLACGDREWWIPRGVVEPRCWHCEPPSSPSLVAQHYFFDDYGVRFLVLFCNGREEWVRQ